MNKKMIDNFDEYRINFLAVRFVFVYYEFGCLRIFVALSISRLPNFTGMSIILQPHATGFMPYEQNYPSKKDSIRTKALSFAPFNDKSLCWEKTGSPAVMG